MLFSEVYSTYFNAVAAMINVALSSGITERKIDEITADKAFSESILTILPSIKNEDWLVMNKSLQTPIKHPPTMPLTTLQKRWLKSLLLDSRIALFSPDASGLEDVEPLFYPTDFVFFDRYQDGDPFLDEAYIRHFRTILLALKENRRVYIKQITGKNRAAQGRYIPLKIEYSTKDDKFRALTASGRYSAYINIARITECELLETYVQREVHFPPRRERTLTFTLIDERNALDRCLLHFSDCRKETQRTGVNTFEVTLWYECADETEMLIRILQFGPMVKVIQPESFIKLIQDRLSMQRALNLD